MYPFIIRIRACWFNHPISTLVFKGRLRQFSRAVRPLKTTLRRGSEGTTKGQRRDNEGATKGGFAAFKGPCFSSKGAVSRVKTAPFCQKRGPPLKKTARQRPPLMPQRAQQRPPFFFQRGLRTPLFSFEGCLFSSEGCLFCKKGPFEAASEVPQQRLQRGVRDLVQGRRTRYYSMS